MLKKMIDIDWMGKEQDQACFVFEFGRIFFLIVI